MSVYPYSLLLVQRVRLFHTCASSSTHQRHRIRWLWHRHKSRGPIIPLIEPSLSNHSRGFILAPPWNDGFLIIFLDNAETLEELVPRRWTNEITRISEIRSTRKLTSRDRRIEYHAVYKYWSRSHCLCAAAPVQRLRVKITHRDARHERTRRSRRRGEITRHEKIVKWEAAREMKTDRVITSEPIHASPSHTLQTADPNTTLFTFSFNRSTFLLPFQGSARTKTCSRPRNSSN